MNAPKELDVRRKELRAKLRGSSDTQIAPKWTKQEMTDAAQRLMASVLNTGKLPS